MLDVFYAYICSAMPAARDNSLEHKHSLSMAVFQNPG